MGYILLSLLQVPILGMQLFYSRPYPILGREGGVRVSENTTKFAVLIQIQLVFLESIPLVVAGFWLVVSVLKKLI